MAFTVEGHKHGKVFALDDPRYVQYYFRFTSKVDGEIKILGIKHHECSEEELDLFEAPSEQTLEELGEIKSSQDRKLFCIDWDDLKDELKLYGN